MEIERERPGGNGSAAEPASERTVNFDDPAQAYACLSGMARGLAVTVEAERSQALLQAQAFTMMALAGMIRRAEERSPRIVIPRVRSL